MFKSSALRKVLTVCYVKTGTNSATKSTKNLIFVDSFGTCRYCLMTKSDFDSGPTSISECVICTPDSYNCSVVDLADSDALVVQGVKFESTFNRLKSFHVYSPGLPPCLAHDLFEGVVAYDLPLSLKYSVKNKKMVYS